ncbi:MAG: hypothetical protein JW786_10960 [Desulfobacterales bacterium]|nr:hypothetical protein [Desulfobacterales bacterium]
MTELIFFAKIFVTILAVVLLSLIAEHVSPRSAGIFSAYPLGAAIALFFFGLENSPVFASDSAIYTMTGLVATQSFVYFYFKSSLYFKRFEIFLSSITAIIGYFIVIWLLHFIKFNTFTAIMIPITSIFVFVYLLKEIKNAQIENKIQLNYKVLSVRAISAAVIILLITGTVKYVGPIWAGLFSAFPITLFPLMLIVHFSYNRQHVHTIIKNFPLGLGASITYSLTVSILYPIVGIYIGTVISYIMASFYLIIYHFINRIIVRYQDIYYKTLA